MFLGTHTPRLDDKGRLILPAKFRDELAEGLVVTRGQERCLYVWPMAEFARLTEQMRQAPVTNKSARDYRRRLRRGAGQAGSNHHPASTSSVRRTGAGLRRDRSHEPGGDLGCRGLGALLQRAGAEVRGSQRGGVARDPLAGPHGAARAHLYVIRTTDAWAD